MIFNPGIMPQASGGGGAVVGMYTGDGASSKTIEFNIEPAVVIIYDASSSSFGNAYIFMINSNGYGLRLNNNQQVRSYRGTILGNQLTLIIENTLLNVNGYTYHYIAIPKA